MTEIYYGGQAIIEGVMMKAPSHYAMAVRKADGSIKVEKKESHSILNKYKFLKFPFVRGIIYLFEMMMIGIHSLSWSANEQADDDNEQISKTEMVGTIALSFILGVGLFIVLPLFLTKFITADKGILFNAIDGFLRLVIFITYIKVISMMADVKTLFQYHGAEHKTINCYEAKKDLTVDNVKPFTTLHPRCGTSFIIIVIAISIVLFSLITDPRISVKLLSRIILIPVIAAVSYETLKFSAKHLSFRNLLIIIICLFIS